MRVMLFTDTLGDVNGVCRFIQNMGAEAHATGHELRIVTSTRMEVPDVPYISNHAPVFAGPLPGYKGLEVVLPPMLRMLREADRFQPDVVHVSTPGPVGTTGLIASKMLRAPVVGVYHTDFPAYIEHLFQDEVYAGITAAWMRVFYARFRTILTRSEDYIDSLMGLGLSRERMVRLSPGVDLDTFSTEFRDPGIWPALGASPGSVKVLYTGRVSVEKNLPLLAEVWPGVRRACARRGVEVELVIVGDGPYRDRMEEALAGEGAAFVGVRRGRELSALYASSDLFVFPSTTDTLGQVVLESQASGLPVIVSDQGGPKEVVDDGISGLVLPADARGAWSESIVRLVCAPEARERMGRSAQTRAARFSMRACFEQFWRVHAEVDPRAHGARGPARASRRAPSVG